MSASLTPETRFRIPPNVYARAFGDEIVLLDFARGEYFGLDEVGAEVWKQLEAGAALREIAKHIALEWEVTEERALADVQALVSQMTSEKLVELA